MSTEHRQSIHSEPIIPNEVFRQEVGGLTMSKDSETETRIINGYKDLFSSASSSYRIHLSTLEEVQRVKTFMTEIFLASINQLPVITVAKKRAIYEHWGRGILNPLEVVVLIRRFGLNDGNKKTYQQVSDSLGYKTGQRSRQIEAKGLRTLKNALRARRSESAVFEIIS